MLIGLVLVPTESETSWLRALFFLLSVERVLDGVPFDELRDSLHEHTLFKGLAETLLAQVAQADQ